MVRSLLSSRTISKDASYFLRFGESFTLTGSITLGYRHMAKHVIQLSFNYHCGEKSNSSIFQDLEHLYDFQTIGYGGHFVFQNESKILHTINVTCTFCEDILVNE